METVNERERIDKSLVVLKQFRDNRELWKQEDKVLQVCKMRYKLIYAQIHLIDAPERSADGERDIRELLKSVGGVDLPICEKKIGEFQKSIQHFKQHGEEKVVNKLYAYLKEWLALYENNYALMAFRSLRHYANFMEWERRDNDKVWKYSVDPNGDNGYSGVNYPFFYYFNKMVLSKDIKFISKQQATGTGKSYSNIMGITWVLGIDADNDFMVVLGNPTLVLTNTKGIIDTMISPRYAKVFPEYAKYHNIDGDIKNNMFSICRAKEGEISISHSNKALNVKVVSKDTSVDGVRVRFLFLDDVCRSKDAGNNKQHETDVSNFWNSWFKRNYNLDDFYIVAGGTAYSIYDILSSLKSYYSKGKVKRSTVNKFTTLSLDEKSVFISVPALDPDTDESTYPQRYSTAEKRAMRDRNFRDFMAMEQQQPMPPETTPFCWEKIQTYDVIPSEGRSEYCWATIDPVRVGGDNFAMPIFTKVGDMFYLKDCIYQNVEQEKLYQLVVDKIKQHKITQLMIERNTDTSLKKLLEDMLKENGVGYCSISEVYTFEQKNIRITNQQNNIKTQIRFPAQHIYGHSSEMGKFMYDIVSYSFVQKNEHDDSIDAVTMFCETLMKGKQMNYGTVGTFRR